MFGIDDIIIFGASYYLGNKLGNNINKAEAYSEAANELNTEAVQIVNDANRNLEISHKAMTGTLVELGKTKKDILTKNIIPTVKIMGGLYKNLKLNRDTQGLRELEDAGFKEKFLSEVQEISESALALSNTKKVTAADNLYFISMGVLGGTAILNPLLAIPALPAVLLYSSSKADEAETEFYKAATRLDEARYHSERCKNSCALFKAITERGKQINGLLLNLKNYFDSSLAQLQTVVNRYSYNYSYYSKEAKIVVFFNWQIAQTVKIIIDTSMICEDGSLNIEMEQPLEMGTKTLRLLSD